jgi:endonuclease I
MFRSPKKILIFALSLLLLVVIVGCNLFPTSSTTLETTTSQTQDITDTTTQGSSSTSSITTAEPTSTTSTTDITTETTTIFTTSTTSETTTTTSVSTTTTVITEAPTTTFTETTTAVFISDIEVINITKDTYQVGEDFLPSSIEVVANLSNGVQATIQYGEYSISGFNTRDTGEITVHINYQTFTTAIVLTIVDDSSFVIDMPYYNSASGLSGNTLFLELRSIINNGFSGVSYGASRYILDETDADPNNPGNVILVYLGTSVSGVWDAGYTWNREHVWPQLLLPDSASNSSTNTASDLHNLKPANPSMNSSRLNKYYDNITTSESYEPRDEVKGDIARILLYMITMYPELSLVDREPNYLEMGLLSVLLTWHDTDPVDDFERNRNDIIYANQYNRNPYIDYPEFVDLIWS